MNLTEFTSLQTLTHIFTESFTEPTLSKTNWTIAGSTCKNANPTMGQLYLNETASYSTKSVAITNNTLSISAINFPVALATCKSDFDIPNVSKNYSSTRIHSNTCYSHGVFSVRAKMPNGVYTWPAIWLQCFNCTDAETEYFEIDLIETYGPKLGYSGEMSAFYSEYTSSTHSENFIDESYDLIDAFHEYTVVWVAGYIGFYVDGVEIGSGFNYSGIEEAVMRFDNASACAVLNINLAIEGKARDGIAPNYTQLAGDQESWTPLEIKSVNIYQVI
ncbi:hypothetical protein HK100_008657 [Physocladia obscura]|uniref:GH16 domain-containing protein n=1 Tax=Physocladia obscura TaxID=109957 RepID=A0AAD5XAI4_9FUNG|nr:hypothetical protein HK100_008657 [Physocladia obscura]